MPDFQLVIHDTPGFHKPKDALGNSLNFQAMSSLSDVDLIVMLIDASTEIGRGDAWIAKRIKRSKLPKICVLAKSDTVSSDVLKDQEDAAASLTDWDLVTHVSAKTGDNVDELIEAIKSFLSSGPAYYPPDMSSDQSLEMFVSEFVREKVFRDFRQEVPYSVSVVTEEMQYKKKKNLYVISATIYVERESQKAIILGKGGEAIRKIGTEARESLEELLGAGIYLRLQVKIRKNWRKDPEQLRQLGLDPGPT